MTEEQMEKIQKLKDQIVLYSNTIETYRKAFLTNDGEITPDEQRQLDGIADSIAQINEKIESIENENDGVTFDFSKQRSSISIAASDEVASQFMLDDDDDPITKKINYFIRNFCYN